MESTAVTYRPMVEADLAGSLELWSRTEGMRLGEGDSHEQLRAYLKRNPETSQVAHAGEHLVGTVLAGHDGHRGLLYHLAVDGKSRGHGIGQELVKRSLGALKAQGIERVLILVLKTNEAGKRFWSRGGWEGVQIAEVMAINP